MATNVRVENLTKRYGSFEALGGVSFEVPAGGFCTLLGRSGCGKTTTLRLLAGLDRPDGGSIWLGSEPVSSDRIFVPPEARGVGLVFQSYALWPHMSVYEHLAYPLQARHVSRTSIPRMIKRAVDMVDLSAQLDRYPSELSGGQQQRVALARAVVFEPAVLLLDEPLSNLDAELRQQMRTELLALHQRLGITSIYVTHDQLEAMALSDLIVVMNEGGIVEIGSPDDIYDRPRSVFTASFVGAANLVPGTVSEVKGEFITIRVSDGTPIRGVAAAELRVGDRAVLAVKPEDVSIQGPGDQANTLPAVVKQSTYLGAHVAVQLTAAGVNFRVQLDKARQLRSGDAVRVVLPADRVSILSPDAVPGSEAGQSGDAGAIPAREVANG